MTHKLDWVKFHPFTDQTAYLCLVDHMGCDAHIAREARASYGKENQLPNYEKDRGLIRRLMDDQHTSPFEQVEIKFQVQVPMDCWRQWIRHRTANVNEYSTRYMEAIDAFQITTPEEWRLQSSSNKQGSAGYLTEWPQGTTFTERLDGYKNEYIEAQLPNGELIAGVNPHRSPGEFLHHSECEFHNQARILYQERLALGIAREQARKDLPLSTYTRAYWKCDLHNIFNFLRLRLDPHAQKEIRLFAGCMYTIVAELFPIACEAFNDYVLKAKRFSRMEMQMLRANFDFSNADWSKPDNMTDNEWKKFLVKLA